MGGIGPWLGRPPWFYLALTGLKRFLLIPFQGLRAPSARCTPGYIMSAFQAEDQDCPFQEIESTGSATPVPHFLRGEHSDRYRSIPTRSTVTERAGKV